MSVRRATEAGLHGEQAATTIPRTMAILCKPFIYYPSAINPEVLYCKPLGCMAFIVRSLILGWPLDSKHVGAAVTKAHMQRPAANLHVADIVSSAMLCCYECRVVVFQMTFFLCGIGQRAYSSECISMSAFP